MTHRYRSACLLAGCISVTVLAGCSSNSTPTAGHSAASGSRPGQHATESAPPGDIPDTQHFNDYFAPRHAFSLKVPEGWAMTRSGQAVVYTDKYNSIRIEAHPAPRPTVGSARDLELPAIKAAVSGYAPGDVKAVQRASGIAILITYRADSAPNPVTGKVVVETVERYEFWRNGTEVVLTLSAPLGADNVDPWRKVTDAFRWSQ